MSSIFSSLSFDCSSSQSSTLSLSLSNFFRFLRVQYASSFLHACSTACIQRVPRTGTMWQIADMRSRFLFAGDEKLIRLLHAPVNWLRFHTGDSYHLNNMGYYPRPPRERWSKINAVRVKPRISSTAPVPRKKDYLTQHMEPESVARLVNVAWNSNRMNYHAGRLGKTQKRTWTTHTHKLIYTQYIYCI